MEIIKAVLIILTLSLALAATKTANATLLSNATCAPVAAGIHTCGDALLSGSTAAVSPECCAGLGAVAETVSHLGLETLCRCVADCLAVHFPMIIGYVQQGATAAFTTVMQTICNVNVPCLT